MDPKFSAELRQAYRIGRHERELERRKEVEAQKESCERGAVAIKQMFQDPNYQKEAMVAFQKGNSYCIPLQPPLPRDDIRNCLTSNVNTDCRNLNDIMDVTKGPGLYSEILCLRPREFMN